MSRPSASTGYSDGQAAAAAAINNLLVYAESGNFPTLTGLLLLNEVEAHYRVLDGVDCPAYDDAFLRGLLAKVEQLTSARHDVEPDGPPGIRFDQE